MHRLVLWAQTYKRALPTIAMRSAPPTDADGVRRPGMRGKRVGHRLWALSDSHGLITADVRENLHALEQGRGCIDQGSRAIEGIRSNTMPPDGGMVGCERRQQAQGKWLFGGILRMRRRFWGPLFGRDALLLERLDLLRPRTEFRGGLREAKAHREGDLGGSPRRATRGFGPRHSPRLPCRAMYRDARVPWPLWNARCRCHQ